MQGIYKLLNKSKNENTFYFEFYSGCATYTCNWVVKDTTYDFIFPDIFLSI